MKICITGGAGFVGANLAKYLKSRGFEVVVFDNLVRRGVELNLPEFKELGIKFIHGDVRASEDVILIPKDTDVICECAAQPSATEGYKNPVFDITNNSMGLINVLERARQIGAGLIFWSTNKTYSGDKVNAIPVIEKETRYVWADFSDAITGFDTASGISQDFPVDGGQHSIYGLSKIQADLACQEWYDGFGVKTVVNRFSCLAGPGQFGLCEQGWFAWFVVAFHFGLPIKFIGFKGKQVRDVLFTEDINRLVELEINNIDKIAGQVFTVGGGMKINTSLIEQYNRLVELFGRLNMPSEKGLPLEIVCTPRKADHCVYISDITKIKNMIGWEPKVGLVEGTSQIIKWVKDNEDRLRGLYL